MNHDSPCRMNTTVFGRNEKQKPGLNIARRKNQQFVQTPTSKLKDRIAQLCEQYGLKFVSPAENYTSKSSFLGHDALPTIGAKPLD
ncbi:MAG: hypothetical protein NWQ28_10690 [Nodularia sp. (in: cyanobacteria)]|nr:hypothetical protein [Nodularia sp. (in: cyanobacteria)]